MKISNCIIYIVLLTGICQSVSAQSIDSDTAEIETVLYVMTPPEYKGGEEEMRKFIAKTLVYPTEGLKDRIEGKVTVQFIVTSKGRVIRPVVIQSDHAILNQNAIDVVLKMPEWTPGNSNGKRVDVYYNLEIVFKAPPPVL